MKDYDLELLNHYLQGIIDCLDVINLCYLFRQQRLYNFQKRRIKLLFEQFQRLSSLYIKTYQEIPKLVNPSARPFSGATLENFEVLMVSIVSQINWENKSIYLLKRALENEQATPGCKKIIHKFIKISQASLLGLTKSKEKLENIIENLNKNT